MISNPLITEAHLLKIRRKQILNKDNHSNTPKQNRNRTKSQECPYGLKQHNADGIAQAKNRQIDKLKGIIDELIAENKRVSDKYIEIAEMFKRDKIGQALNQKMIDQHDYSSNLGFSFKIDSRDCSVRRNNSSYDKNMGLESTEMSPNTTNQPFLDQFNLKTSYNIRNSENGGITNFHNKPHHLIKIPEQPEKQISKIKSEQSVKKIDQPSSVSEITSKSPQLQIIGLKKKLRKLSIKYQDLSKECSYRKSNSKHPKMSSYQTEDIKLKGYQALIQKQQQCIQKIVIQWQQEIQSKDKEIGELTASFLQHKQQLQEQAKSQSRSYYSQIRSFEKQIKQLMLQNKSLIRQNQKLYEQIGSKEKIMAALQKNNSQLMHGRSLIQQKVLPGMQRRERLSSMNSYCSGNILMINGRQYDNDVSDMI